MEEKREIINSMIKKSEDKLESANVLFQNAIYDDCASRVYYAVYHVLVAVLYSKDLEFSSHSQTIGAFNKEFVHASIFPKYFTKKIKSLYDYRESGDYDVNSNITKEIASECLDTASEVVSTISTHLQELFD
jgi:uncharacterized protein (UPF0332 family)